MKKVFLFCLLIASVFAQVSNLSSTENIHYSKDFLYIEENFTFFFKSNNLSLQNLSIYILNKEGSHRLLPTNAKINGEVIGFRFFEPENAGYTNHIAGMMLDIPSSYLKQRNVLWIKYKFGSENKGMGETIYNNLMDHDFSNGLVFNIGEYHPDLEIDAKFGPVISKKGTITFTIKNKGESDIIPGISFSAFGKHEAGNLEFVGPDTLNYSIANTYLTPECNPNADYIIEGDIFRECLITQVHGDVKFFIFKNLELKTDQQLDIDFSITFDNLDETSEVEAVYRYVRDTHVPNEYDVKIISKKSLSVLKEPEINISSPKNWFVELMNITDELIKKNRPKLRIVFVPVGYNSNEDFKNISNNAINHFATVSPFKECNAPAQEISVVYIDPNVCGLNNCSDVCGSGSTSANNCQFLIKECATNNTDTFDLVVGLCKNSSCGGACGGCAAGIPGKSVIVNSNSCGGADAYRIVSHELGHALGLYHIQGPFGVNGCWDDEGGACQGPNAVDCNLPNESRSKSIMAYCPSMEQYGPAAYSYLKDNALSKFMGDCE